MMTIALCYSWFALTMGAISAFAGDKGYVRVMGALCVVGNVAILMALGAFS